MLSSLLFIISGISKFLFDNKEERKREVIVTTIILMLISQSKINVTKTKARVINTNNEHDNRIIRKSLNNNINNRLRMVYHLMKKRYTHTAIPFYIKMKSEL